MKSTSKIIITSIAAIVAISVIALALTLSSPRTDSDVTYIPKRVLTPELETSPTYSEPVQCGESLESIRDRAPFRILVPALLPDGYALQGSDYSISDTVILAYADANVCGADGKKLKDGMLEIVVTTLDSLGYTIGNDFVDAQARTYEGRELGVQTYTFDNGNRAIGYPVGIGTSKVIDENDNVINQENYNYPASVMMVDEDSKTAYSLRAFMPLEDLVKIAQSMK